MKNCPLLVILACLIAPFGYGQESGKHLFILSGQSNMAGLDPDISFTPTVAEALGQDNIIVVKSAQGGQPIRRWYKDWAPKDGEKPSNNGDLYDVLMGKVSKAIEGQTIESVTFVWMQGERDAREQHGEVYAASLQGLIGQVEADLDRDQIHFVIGRLSDFDNDNRQYPHWTMVREAQVQVAEASESGAWVDTDDLNDKKRGEKIVHDLHYTKEGYRLLGERFAEKAIELINK